MIKMPSNFDWTAFTGFQNTPEIGIEFVFNFGYDERMPMFGAKDDVDVIFYNDCGIGFYFV